MSDAAQGCSFRSKFNWGSAVCRLVADGSGLCPRHAAMVKAFGEKRAYRIEYGVRCAACDKIKQEYEVGNCRHCSSHDVCPECLKAKACCDTREEEGLKAEADELEQEAEEKRSKANRLRRARQNPLSDTNGEMGSTNRFRKGVGHDASGRAT
jgi:hypothetical protein